MDDEKRFGWKWTGRMNSQATVFVVVQIRIVFVVQCTCTFTVASIRHRWPFSCCPCWDVRYGAGWGATGHSSAQSQCTTRITILHTPNMKIGTMICILLVPISIRNVNIHKFVRRA